MNRTPVVVSFAILFIHTSPTVHGQVAWMDLAKTPPMG